MDISIILLAHNEGLLVHRTVVGIEKMRMMAHNSDIKTEVLVMLDNANDETREYFFKDFNLDYRFFEVSFGECGRPRNEGVKQAFGKYIALIDGDDIFSSNYLVEAFNLVKNRGENTILHAEYAIAFGEESSIWKLFNQNSVFVNPKSFVEYNPYHAMCFAAKAVFLDYTYNVTKFTEGYGFEDWDWNLRTIVGGYIHEIIPNTVAFIRRKSSGSLVKSQENASAIPLPNLFFEASNFLEIVSKNNTVKEETHDQEETLIRRVSVGSLLRRIYFFLKPKKKQGSSYYFNNKVDMVLLKIKEIFLIFISNRGVKNTEYLSNFSDTFLTTGQLPDAIISQMKLINQIEPEIPFSNSLLNKSYKYVIPPYTESGEFYHTFCEQMKTKKFHLFFVSGLKIGPPDLSSIQRINDFIALGEDVVVFTENSNTEYLDKLDKRVRFFFINDYFKKSTSETVNLVFTKIIQHFKIQSVHIDNSKSAYELYATFGKSIERHAPLFIHVGDKKNDDSRYLSNFAYEDFFKIHKYITLAIVKDKFFIDCLCDMYGYNKKMFKHDCESKALLELIKNR